jgi:hypothetical protein
MPESCHAVASCSFTDKQGQSLAFIHASTLVMDRPPAEADLQQHFGVTPTVSPRHGAFTGTSRPHTPRTKTRAKHYNFGRNQRSAAVNHRASAGQDMPPATK